jgi:hypothetical protein
MTIPEIAAALQHAVAPGVTVAVRPGWRLEQTADALTQSGRGRRRRIPAGQRWRPT